MQDQVQDQAESPSARHQPVVVMTVDGTNPRVMINALARKFPSITVIEEQPQSKWRLLHRRARKLGWIEVAGQLATMIVSRLGKNLSRRRSADILAQYGLSDAADPSIAIVRVNSLNDGACLEALRGIRPAVIFTYSCRILSRETLAAIPCPVINLHSGINPAYRGQMGCYWALVEDDTSNFGATVHLVDAGVDTGGTLYEARTLPSKRDTMATYPLLLAAVSTGMVIRAVDDALAGRLAPYAPMGQSKLRYHPAIWTWAWYGLTKGVW